VRFGESMSPGSTTSFWRTVGDETAIFHQSQGDLLAPERDTIPALWVTLCGTVVRTESASSRVERCSDGIDPEVGVLTRTLSDPCGCDEQRSGLIWGIHP
jgi:hypothetical protein